MLTQQELQDAQDIVYQHVSPTPCYQWPLLAEALSAPVWVKHENHTPTGAFKVRGGLVYLHHLIRSGQQGDLVTATRGNHGQSIPFAARMYDRRVHVYVPEGNSAEKNAAMREWGAELHVVGADFDEARMAAEAHAETKGGHLVGSFHPWLIQGVATYGLELFSSCADLKRVYVPIGMGSGAASLIAVRDLFDLDIEVIGVVAEAAPAMARSLSAGKIEETDSALTFADGVATRVPHPDAFAIMQKGLARVVQVSDDQIADAVRLLFRATHNVAEGAGAAALAALQKELTAGLVAHTEQSAVVLTGGNIDAEWFQQILAGQTPLVA